MRIESSPIPIKERNSVLFLGRGRLDVQDGALVLADESGVRVQIPVGGIASIALEPGTTVTHAAISLAAEVGCLLTWVGEAGVRLYSAGQPGGARADRLLYQAKLALDDDLRLKVVREMYRLRFNEEAPQKRSVDQLRGIEGSRVRTLYEILARQNGVPWNGRNYEVKNFGAGDVVNQCLSAANHCLYGVCETAILAAGYAPAIGFLHTGKPLSFVYDIADIFKFETVTPIAFKIAAARGPDPVRETRIYCRNSFRKHNILERIIPTIEQVLAAGDIPLPGAHSEAMPIAIPNREVIGDAGYRT